MKQPTIGLIKVWWTSNSFPSSLSNNIGRLFWLAQERAMASLQPLDGEQGTFLTGHTFLRSGWNGLVKLANHISGRNVLPPSVGRSCIKATNSLIGEFRGPMICNFLGDVVVEDVLGI
jgi:hypothetical protein